MKINNGVSTGTTAISGTLTLTSLTNDPQLNILTFDSQSGQMFFTSSNSIVPDSASYALNASIASYASTASYYSGSVVSASYALTASYYSGSVVSASYAGSAMSSSYASSASYAVTASHYNGSVVSASYALNSESSSYASSSTNSTSASYAESATTASYALTASYLEGYISPFPYTGSAAILGSLQVTGSSDVLGDLTVTGKITAEEFHTEFVSSSVIYKSGSTKFGNSSDDVHSFTGSLQVLGSITGAIESSSYALTASYAENGGGVAVSNNVNNYILTATGGDGINGESGLQFNGSYFYVTGSYGKVSIATDYGQHYIDAKNESNAYKKLVFQTSGMLIRPNGGDYTTAIDIQSTGATTFPSSVSASSFLGNATSATSASYALSASYARTSTSASYALTASYFNGSVLSASYALNSTTAFTANSATTATIAASATSASYSSVAQTVLGTVTSASYALSASSLSYSGLTGTAPTWNQNTSGNAATATSASYASVAQTVLGTVTSASYALSATSATSATTAGSATSSSYATTSTTAASATSASYASTAGGVVWTNVSGRPTAVSSFTNDSGYLTSLTGAVLKTGDHTMAGSLTAVAFYNSSDSRLKSIIKRDGDVAYYKWLDGRDDKEHIGYIAQEQQQIHPDQVGTDGEFLTVNYTEILVAKVRELEKEIELLKSKI
jgi:hypothetical protein